MNFGNSSNRIFTDILVGLKKSHILKRVLSSEKLIVGVSAGIKGLACSNQAGFYEGFDIDLAKAISAGIFCDDGECEFIVINPTERFSAINSGKLILGSSTQAKPLKGLRARSSFEPTFGSDDRWLIRANVRRDL